MARSKRKSEIDEVDWDLGKLLQAIGKQIADKVEVNELVEQLGVEEFLAKLSPAVRQKLKERMK